MPNNYVLLETIALTQSAASVTFDNLPTSGYTDLKIVASVRSTGSTGNYDPLLYRLNNSTSGYTARDVGGNGASAGSGSNTTLTSTAAGGTWGRILDYGIDQSTSTASTFSSLEMYIPNYLSSNNKSLSVDHVMENNATNAWMEMVAGLWSNTASITSISFALYYGSFAANSTFSLYGVAALGTTPVVAPKATGGNSIENDGTYWIHTFTSSGTFTPQVGLNCDYLVVAGGGGGGSNRGAGGGGGGYLTSSTTISAGTNYTVTIGAGGAGAAASLRGSSGSDSTFIAVTSTGGGGGGSRTAGLNNGLSGGSGGGASRTGSVGAGTSGQGNNGGLGTNGDPYDGGGGGGGAGGVGGNCGRTLSGVGGNGGAGSSSSITGTAVIRAWGGVGYYGDNGAAGAGGTAATGSQGNGAGVSAGANTGGGGNAINVADVAGSGGSGVVIIRYPIN